MMDDDNNVHKEYQSHFLFKSLLEFARPVTNNLKGAQ